MLIIDMDDFGANHEISDQCQSHDCRDVLVKFKEANPAFKATLFAIPGEMTPELVRWVVSNSEWVELAYHGAYHSSNYECEKMTYEDFGMYMNHFEKLWGHAFSKGFKAPGWQISDDCYQWLLDHGWWVADKSYNNDRRPKELSAYVNYDGNDMRVHKLDKVSELIPATHHHCWNTMDNGVYQQYDYLIDLIKSRDDWAFVSEAINEKN